MGNERLTQLATERATLIALLHELPRSAPLPIISGVNDLSHQRKMFLTATCCANIIAEICWLQAQGCQVTALAGIDALVQGIKENIKCRQPFSDEVIVDDEALEKMGGLDG